MVTVALLLLALAAIGFLVWLAVRTPSAPPRERVTEARLADEVRRMDRDPDEFFAALDRERADMYERFRRNRNKD